MDQIKTGAFIKALRKEKGLTQEQLAEQFNVSRRSVSRWETGSNLPDLDILIEMSDYFEVGLRDLLNGERSSSASEDETALMIAQLSSDDKLKIARRMHWLFIAGFFASVLYMFLYFTDRSDNFLGGLCMGICCGMMIVGIIMTSRNAARIRNAKFGLLNRFKKIPKA